MRVPQLPGLISLCVGLILALSACSEDGAAGPGAGSGGTGNGVFLDSAVEGLSFESGSETGLTSATGGFKYPRSASSIRFEIGDIELGSAKPAALLSPLNLSPDFADLNEPIVNNIARVLQTLDDDGNPDNGILITAAVRAGAIGRAINFDQPGFFFESDGEVESVVSALTQLTTAGERPLVSAAAAQAHLAATLIGALAGQHTGEYCRDGSEMGPPARAGNWSLTIVGSNVSMSFQGTPAISASGSIDAMGNINLNGSAGELLFCAYDGVQFWGRWYTTTLSGSFSQRNGCGH